MPFLFLPQNVEKGENVKFVATLQWGAVCKKIIYVLYRTHSTLKLLNRGHLAHRALYRTNNMRRFKADRNNRFSAKSPTIIRSRDEKDPQKLAWQDLPATPTVKWPSCWPRTRWRDYIFHLIWSRLGEDPAELSEVDENCEVFLVRGLLPLKPARGKAGVKMNGRGSFVRLWLRSAVLCGKTKLWKLGLIYHRLYAMAHRFWATIGGMLRIFQNLEKIFAFVHVRK